LETVQDRDIVSLGNVERISYDVFMNWKAYMACNFNCRVKTGVLLKVVTESHIHWKSGTQKLCRRCYYRPL